VRCNQSKKYCSAFLPFLIRGCGVDEAVALEFGDSVVSSDGEAVAIGVGDEAVEPEFVRDDSVGLIEDETWLL